MNRKMTASHVKMGESDSKQINEAALTILYEIIVQIELCSL